jgi:SAM-dependent methyltransferase
MLIKKIKKIIRKLLPPKEMTEKELINFFHKNGSIPWSFGYNEYKWENIKNYIYCEEILNSFRNKQLQRKIGFRIDERAVEYPWIISNLNDGSGKILDAGSTFNFQLIIDHNKIKNKDLTIYTFYPESNNYSSRKVSYVYGDLRDLPFKNELFDEIVCQSTLEHIDKDNSMYGYELKSHNDTENKSYDYLKVIDEFLKVLKPGGLLLLTFPFGRFEDHNFFQQFDEEMLNKIIERCHMLGNVKIDFFKYTSDGWIFSDLNSCKDEKSYNPHSGIGKGNDNAAHSRAIACVKFIKNQ